MKTVKYEIEIEVPDDSATDAEIDEWVEFNVGYSGGMTSANPLCHYDMDTCEIRRSL